MYAYNGPLYMVVTGLCISNADKAAVHNKQQAARVQMKAPFLIELKPMEIRTFNITVEYF